jgi:hypothetical protein
MILDEESVADEICTIVCVFDKPAGRVRCEFKMALDVVLWIDHDGTTEEICGPFSRTGVVLTEENNKLVLDRGMYMEGMEVKVDEYWREFSQKW